MGTQVGTDDQAFETCLESLMERELVVDGTIAKSGQERDAIWSIRHEVEWLVRTHLISDVSLPIASVNEYVENVTKRICADVADAEGGRIWSLG